MERAAVLGRLTWQTATLQAVLPETETARTLTLAVPQWQGHQPGQHVDLRLTAPDGYTAQRAYSVSSTPGAGLLDLTVEMTPGGEVSPFLVQVARPGVRMELRGPLGGWFVWSPSDPGPTQLIAGGSGVVPLMSMLRTHRTLDHRTPMRLLYSVRHPDAVLFARDLSVGGADAADRPTLVYSRRSPPGASRAPGRVDARDIKDHVIAAERRPRCFVCGPTPFVEAVIGLLLEAGHDPRQIRAERFGAARSSSP